uniref:Uncharacterized protein n=1 Tax=Anguilla anguilla TaxID=7936 RepID=A0A0E9WS06_ANGAN
MPCLTLDQSGGIVICLSSAVQRPLASRMFFFPSVTRQDKNCA